MKILNIIEKLKTINRIIQKGGSVLENDHQEDDTKFNTLARKMIDNN